MIVGFPKYITNKAIVLYLILIVIAPLIYGYPMEWFAYIFGITGVLLFFYFGKSYLYSVNKINPKVIEKKIFWTAFLIRVVYVLISYWFYSEMSDTPPFEFGAADSWYYHNNAVNGASVLFKKDLSYILTYVIDADIADSGFVTYLMFVNKIFGETIIIPRLLNCLFGAYTVVLIYKIANRHFGYDMAKMAAVFCAFMPNLIFYCGLHLKEVIMVFLVVMFINSADIIIVENGKWKKWVPMILAGLALFTFRTVLGVVAFLSFFATLLFTNGKMMSWGKRIVIGMAVLCVLSTVIGDSIKSEVQTIWEKKDTQQQKNMEWRSRRKNGNEFAKYAGASVFAPLIFTIPFPTLVKTPNQEDLRLINGGNYVKNIMSFFTIAAVVLMIISGDWRKHALVLSFTIGYLVVITFSEFAHSERFHQPVLPFEMMLAAYGVSLMSTSKRKKWFNIWISFIFVANIGWQWFKLAGRGM